MTKAAFTGEKLNHHPEWFSIYNKVRIHLTTHKAEGMSPRGLALVEILDTLVESL